MIAVNSLLILWKRTGFGCFYCRLNSSTFTLFHISISSRWECGLLYHQKLSPDPSSMETGVCVVICAWCNRLLRSRFFGFATLCLFMGRQSVIKLAFLLFPIESIYKESISMMVGEIYWQWRDAYEAWNWFYMMQGNRLLSDNCSHGSSLHPSQQTTHPVSLVIDNSSFTSL